MLIIYIEASKNSRQWKVLVDPKLEFSEAGAARIQEMLTRSGPPPLTEDNLRDVSRDIIQEVKRLYLGSDVWFRDPFAEEDPPGSMNEWRVEVKIT